MLVMLLQAWHACALRLAPAPAFRAMGVLRVQVTYEQLLEIFFENHDPTQLNQQGNDTGTQYRCWVHALWHPHRTSRLWGVAVHRAWLLAPPVRAGTLRLPRGRLLQIWDLLPHP